MHHPPPPDFPRMPRLTVGVQLDAATLAAIERLRGRESRSAYIRRTVEAALAACDGAPPREQRQ